MEIVPGVSGAQTVKSASLSQTRVVLIHRSAKIALTACAAHMSGAISATRFLGNALIISGKENLVTLVNQLARTLVCLT
jgi:hypothetical protein